LSLLLLKLWLLTLERSLVMMKLWLLTAKLWLLTVKLPLSTFRRSRVLPAYKLALLFLSSTIAPLARAFIECD
jgi:hypothetical protein